MRPTEHLVRRRPADPGAPAPGPDRPAGLPAPRATPAQLRSGADHVLVRVAELERRIRHGSGVRLDAIESVTRSLRGLQDAIEAAVREHVTVDDLIELRQARMTLGRALRTTLDLLAWMEGA